MTPEASRAALSASAPVFKRVYVWELPVRVYHWLNALCVLVLTVTGILIAHPPAFASATEASYGERCPWPSRGEAFQVLGTTSW